MRTARSDVEPRTRASRRRLPAMSKPGIRAPTSRKSSGEAVSVKSMSRAATPLSGSRRVPRAYTSLESDTSRMPSVLSVPAVSRNAPATRAALRGRAGGRMRASRVSRTTVVGRGHVRVSSRSVRPSTRRTESAEATYRALSDARRTSVSASRTLNPPDDVVSAPDAKGASRSQVESARWLAATRNPATVRDRTTSSRPMSGRSRKRTSRVSRETRGVPSGAPTWTSLSTRWPSPPRSACPTRAVVPGHGLAAAAMRPTAAVDTPSSWSSSTAETTITTGTPTRTARARATMRRQRPDGPPVPGARWWSSAPGSGSGVLGRVGALPPVDALRHGVLPVRSSDVVPRVSTALLMQDLFRRRSSPGVRLLRRWRPSRGHSSPCR